MSADVLREAAALMRERADAAIKVTELSGTGWYTGIANLRVDWVEDATHIASWHPAVALAVADWLDYMSKAHEDGYLKGSHALVVARAYLGSTS